MKKKSELISANEIKLASGIGIPAINHREVNSDFIDNGYADVIFNNGIDSVDLIVRGSAIGELSAQFVKQGRIVVLNGWFKKASGGTEPVGTPIFTFKTSGDALKLLPIDSQFIGYSYHADSSIGIAIKQIGDDIGLFSTDVIPTGPFGNNNKTYRFSLTYFTKE